VVANACQSTWPRGAGNSADTNWTVRRCSRSRASSRTRITVASTQRGTSRSDVGTWGRPSNLGTTRHPVSASMGPMPGHGNRGRMISGMSDRAVVGEMSGAAPTTGPVESSRWTSGPTPSIDPVIPNASSRFRLSRRNCAAKRCRVDEGSRTLGPSSSFAASTRMIDVSRPMTGAGTAERRPAAVATAGDVTRDSLPTGGKRGSLLQTRPRTLARDTPRAEERGFGSSEPRPHVDPEPGSRNVQVLG
jgi:hypothetical protein